MIIKKWKEFSHYGVDTGLPIAATRKTILTNQLAVISFIIVFLLNLSFIFNPEFGFDPIGFFSSFLILTTPLLNKLKRPNTAAFVFATLTPIALTFFSSMNKTIIPQPLPIISYIIPKFFIISLLILPLVVIDSRRKIPMIVAIAINISCLFLMDFLNAQMGVAIDFNNLSFESYKNLNFLLVLPMAMLILGFLFLNSITNKSEDEILKQNKNLELAHHKIEQVHKDLTDSIEYAKYIQNALLSDIKILQQNFSDVFIYNHPKSIVSGDFYYFKDCSVQHKACKVIVVADSTGHGVPGGFMSVLGLSLINDIIASESFTDASDILNQLRNRVKIALNQTGKPLEQRDGMEMALVVYYPNENTIEFAGAKNPLVIIDKNHKLSTLKGDKMPIGYHVTEKPFIKQNYQLSEGDMCYMFTDGIIDQMNTEKTRLMSKNFKRWLINCSDKNGDEQKEIIQSKLEKWMTYANNKKVEQLDDMLLLGFRVK